MKYLLKFKMVVAILILMVTAAQANDAATSVTMASPMSTWTISSKTTDPTKW